jgi:hypothetical protein
MRIMRAVRVEAIRPRRRRYTISWPRCWQFSLAFDVINTAQAVIAHSAPRRFHLLRCKIEKVHPIHSRGSNIQLDNHGH